jgi:hypothetical protein
MRMKIESAASVNDVIVKDAQRPPVNILGVVIVAEGKVPAGVELAELPVISLVGWNCADHKDLQILV